MKAKEIILILLLVSLSLGCLEKVSFEEGKKTPPSQGDAPYLPIKTALDISNAPALGQTAELTVTFTTGFNASDFSASIDLPEGLEFVSGTLFWKGEVIEGVPIQFKAIVKATKTGTWLIRTKGLGIGDQLYLSISEHSAQVSKEPFTHPRNRSREKVMAEVVNESEIPPRTPSNFTGISPEPTKVG